MNGTIKIKKKKKKVWRMQQTAAPGKETPDVVFHLALWLGLEGGGGGSGCVGCVGVSERAKGDMVECHWVDIRRNTHTGIKYG